MFKLKRISLQIELLLIELQLFFSDHQLLHFQSLILSLLLIPYKAKVVGMYKILAFGSNQSKHNKFLLAA